MSIRCDAATDRARVASAPSGSVTAMFWCRWSSFPTQYQAVFWSGDTTAGANAYDASAMLVNGNPANTVEFWGKNSTAPRMGPTAALNANQWYHWAITYSTANGGACELFQDGVSVATGTMGSAAAFQTEDTQFGNDANSDENPQARIMCGKMWNRILTAAEIRAEMWSAMPVNADSLWGCWSMFDDDGGLHDLSGNGRHLVEAGTLTVEASDCGAVFDAPFTQGGWNRTAAAPGGATIAPAQAGITIAGLAPTILAEKAVAPITGAATIQGLQPSLLTELRAAPGAGAIVIQGLAPTVVATTTVSPATGLVVIGGLAPALSVPNTVAPAQGALTISGLAPTLVTAGVVAPSTGLAIIQGLAPTLSLQKVVSPATGAAVIAGQQPTIIQGATQNVAAGVGALTIAGLAPSLITAVTVSPSPGSIVMAGRAPSLNTEAPFGWEDDDPTAAVLAWNADGAPSSPVWSDDASATSQWTDDA